MKRDQLRGHPPERESDRLPTSISIRKEDRDRLDRAARREDRSRSAIIRSAIRHYCDQVLGEAGDDR